LAAVTAFYAALWVYYNWLIFTFLVYSMLTHIHAGAALNAVVIVDAWIPIFRQNKSSLTNEIR
jgi:hypothetical protein